MTLPELYAKISIMRDTLRDCEMTVNVSVLAGIDGPDFDDNISYEQLIIDFAQYVKKDINEVIKDFITRPLTMRKSGAIGIDSTIFEYTDPDNLSTISIYLDLISTL